MNSSKFAMSCKAFQIVIDFAAWDKLRVDLEATCDEEMLQFSLHVV